MRYSLDKYSLKDLGRVHTVLTTLALSGKSRFTCQMSGAVIVGGRVSLIQTFFLLHLLMFLK